MKVNLELSKELKKEMRHRIGQCYKNAFSLLRDDRIEKMAVGYVTREKDKVAVRHAFGIKDGEIVDSTFGANKKYVEGLEYHIAFTADRTNVVDIIQNYEPNLFGYDFNAERVVIDKIKEEGYQIILDRGGK